MDDTMQLPAADGGELDEQTRAALGRGDARAWEHEYRYMQGPLYGYCLRLTGSEADAADLVQETFARTMRRCRDRGTPAHLRAFLYTSARNGFLDRTRRAHHRPLDDEVAEVVPADAAGDGTDPSTAALVADQRGDVWAGLAELPERQRVAIAMCDMEGCSYAQVADALDLQENAVAQLVFRARAKLRLLLRLRQVDLDSLPEACRANAEPISRLMDGALKQPAAGELEQHLAACDACAGVRESFELARSRFRALVPALPVGFAGADGWHELAASAGAEGLLHDTGDRDARGGDDDDADTDSDDDAEHDRARDDDHDDDTHSEDDHDHDSDSDDDHAAGAGPSRRTMRRVAVGAVALLLLAGVTGIAMNADDVADDPVTEVEAGPVDSSTFEPTSEDDGDGEKRSGDRPADDEPAVSTDGSSEPPPTPTSPEGGTGTTADPTPDRGADTAPGETTTPDDAAPEPTPAPANLVASGASWSSGVARVTISNAGGTTAPASTTRFTIGTRTYTASTAGLAPGVSTTVTASTSCIEGTFTVTALADATGAVSESSDGDNSTSASASNVC